MICNTAFLEGLEKGFFDLQDSGGQEETIFPPGLHIRGETRCHRLTDQVALGHEGRGDAIQLRRRRWGGTLPRLA